jgi:hypothetical protein
MIPNISKNSTPSPSLARSRDTHRAPAPGVQAGLASGSHCTSPDHQEIHRRRIAECAYFMAEKRQFAGGDPIQDWLTAEHEVCCPTS